MTGDAMPAQLIRGRRAVATLLSLAIVFLSASIPARASFPGGNGRILYRYGNDLWTVKADGSDPVRMTHSSSIVGPDPSWSPEGSRVAFWRDGDLWIVNADGTGATDLTNGSNTGVSPDWAPDGLHLVYVGPDGQIWTIGTDGTGAAQLVTHANHDARGPSWSPDGTSIAFSAYDFGTHHVDLYVAPAAHLNAPVQITNTNGIEYDVGWSPDSSRILFSRDGRKGNIDVRVIDPDGTHPHRLTTNPAKDSYPSWSPDGTKIAFSSDRRGQLDAYVMNADGTNQHRITTSGTLGAAWQPCPTTCAPVT
jgi:Tol biopolymer transport system component